MKFRYYDDQELNEIELGKDNASKIFKEGGFYKFVLYEMGDEVVTTIFSEAHVHADMAKHCKARDGLFEGAGSLLFHENKCLMASFGSSSCMKQFGYDRPEGHAKCSGLIEEMRGALNDLVGI